MKWSLNFYVVLIALTFCGSRCESGKSCPDDIICTMMFKSISVEIMDSEGEHVELSSAELQSEYLDNPIEILTETNSGMSYQIVNDSHMKFLNHSQARAFFLKGWIKDSLVIDEKYKFRHDCCHVILESGPEKIIIDYQTLE